MSQISLRPITVALSVCVCACLFLYRWALYGGFWPGHYRCKVFLTFPRSRCTKKKMTIVDLTMLNILSSAQVACNRTMLRIDMCMAFQKSKRTTVSSQQWVATEFIRTRQPAERSPSEGKAVFRSMEGLSTQKVCDRTQWQCLTPPNFPGPKQIANLIIYCPWPTLPRTPTRPQHSLNTWGNLPGFWICSLKAERLAVLEEEPTPIPNRRRDLPRRNRGVQGGGGQFIL